MIWTRHGDRRSRRCSFAFEARIKGSSDVSENTKNAQAIAKAWRSAVHTLDPDRFQIEALVAPELDQKIDIVDSETACAYEFKVSGKSRDVYIKKSA